MYNYGYHASNKSLPFSWVYTTAIKNPSGYIFIGDSLKSAAQPVQTQALYFAISSTLLLHARHSERMNVALLDGHVQSATPHECFDFFINNMAPSNIATAYRRLLYFTQSPGVYCTIR